MGATIMGYSPFDVSRAIGTNLSRGFAKVKEESAIDSILSNALQSEDPSVLQQSIGKILSQVSPERQPAAIQLLQQRGEAIKSNMAERSRANAYQQAGFSPEMQYLSPQLQGQLAKNKATQDQYEGIFGSPQNSNIAKNSNAAQPTQNVASTSNELKNLTRDQLIKGLGIPSLKPMFQGELDRRQHEESLLQKKELGKLARDATRAGKTLERADELAASVPIKQSALNQMNDAISKGNLGFWSSDNLADLTGVEAFRSVEGAQFKTAVKEYFLNNLSRVKGRPNQWIEQQVLDAVSKIGRTTAANLITDRTLQNEINLENKYIELANEIYNEQEKLTGSPPGDLASRVNKELRKYADESEIELFNDIRAIRSIEDKKYESFKPVKKGTVISDVMIQSLLNRFSNDTEKAKQEAKKLGYKFGAEND